MIPFGSGKEDEISMTGRKDQIECEGLKGRSVLLWSTCALLISFFSGCADEEKKLYLIEEIRTPVLQVFQRDDARSDSDRGCESFDADADGVGEIWCQQFPMRPAVDTLFRFVVMSPEGSPMQVSFETIRQFRNLANIQGAEISAANTLNSSEVTLEEFGLRSLDHLAQTPAETPLRIQEVYFSLTLPSTENFIAAFQESGSLPGYTMSYRVESDSHRSDAGNFSFFVLPDPETSDIYDQVASQAGEEQNINPQTLEQIKRQARTNTPPELGDFTFPNSGVKKNKENKIEIAVGEDADEDAKARLQWYTTAGELGPERSRKIKWKPDEAGQAAIFVTLRDLQGGLDFKYVTVDVIP